MNLRIFTILIFLVSLLPTGIFSAVIYSRTPGGMYITSPVTISVSVDNFSDYLFESQVNSFRPFLDTPSYPQDTTCYAPSTLVFSEAIFNPPEPAIGVLINAYEDGSCQNEIPGNSYYYLEGTGMEGEDGSIIFYILDEAYVPLIPATEEFNITPVVKMEDRISGDLQGKITLKYSVSDPDNNKGALNENPMSFYYCDKLGIECWEIAQGQPNTGEFEFDTAKISDGEYKIKIKATDGYGYSGETFTEFIYLDNTVSAFDISVSPSSFIREKDIVNLKIISSEELKSAPIIKIIQEDAPEIQTQSFGRNKEFYASSSLLRGFPGKAIIEVLGEDLMGNIGGVVSSGGTFFVERFGPPPPTLIGISDNQIFTQPNIEIAGIGKTSVEIFLTLNGTGKFTAKPDGDGNFKISGIVLSSANKGNNTLSIYGIDQKGEQSGEAVLRVKLNSQPKIALISDFSEKISDQKEIKWSAIDSNDDKLIFSIDYSNDGGITWDSIASNLTETTYKFDTSQLADGPNYLLRVTVDDGTEKNTVRSKKFSIENNLPTISLDVLSDYFTNSKTPKITGKTQSVLREIDSVEYSLDFGKSWKNAFTSGGRYNVSFEILITEPLPDGKYTILIRTRDAFKHFVKIARSINIDTLSPEIKITDPAPGEAIEDSMDTDPESEGLQAVLRGNTESGAKIEITLADKIYKATADQNGEFKIKDVAFEKHGINKIQLFVLDLAGNFSKTEDAIIFNNLPQITISNIKEGDFMGSVKEIAWQTSDPDKDLLNYEFSYQNNKGEWKVLSASRVVFGENISKLDLSKIANGKYALKFVVNDGLNGAEKIFNVFVDNIYPSGNFTLKSAEGKDYLATSNSKPEFEGKASDDYSGIQYAEYSINGKDWYKAVLTSGYLQKEAEFKFQHYFSIEDGEYPIQVRITDQAGNITFLAPQKLTIDTTPPHIGSNMISSGALIVFPDEDGITKLFEDADYNILLSASNDAQEVKLRSANESFALVLNKATQLWESRFNFQEPGEYPLEVTVLDKAGNRQSREIANLKILPQSLVLNKENNQPVAGTEITLYFFDQNTNSWLVWDGAAFGQENPQKTGKTGQYGFLVAPGRYRLEASASNFNRVKTNEIEIKNNSLISVNIPLTEREGVLDLIINYFKK